MNRTIALGLVALIATATGACSSTKPPTVEQVAKQIGCTNLQPADYEIDTSARGQCTYQGGQVWIWIFPNEAARKQWEQTPEDSGCPIHKPLYVVCSQPS